MYTKKCVVYVHDCRVLTMQAEESIMTEKGSYWQVKTTLKEFSQAKKCSLVCAKIAKNFFPLVTSLSSHLNSIETLQSKQVITNIVLHLRSIVRPAYDKCI